MLLASTLTAVAGIAGTVVLGSGLAAASAAGQIVVDDFAGTTLGTRTVTRTPAADGTGARSAFAQDGGAAAVILMGGDSAAAVQLDYAFPATDLTSGGSDQRLLVELTGMDQSPAGVAPVTVTLSVTDSTRTTGSYARTVPASGSTSLAVELSCAAGSGSGAGGTGAASGAGATGGQKSAGAGSGPAGCLTPTVDPTHATGLRLVISDAAADPGTRTTVGLAVVRADSAPGAPAASASGTPAAQPSVGQTPTPSAAPGSPVTASAAPSEAVRTSPPSRPSTAPVGAASATATIEPRPLSPTRSAVPAAPVFTSAGRAEFALGQPGSFEVATTGGPGTSLSAEALPTGLQLTDNGDGTATLAGTPAFDGGSTVRVVATGARGTATQRLAIEVRSLPAFTSDSTATFVRGAPGSFDLTTTGVPTPKLAVSAGRLPAGLTLTDNHDGTATIAGTPTAASGSVSVGVTASNAAGSTDTTLTVQIQDVPAFTSSDTVLLAGTGGNFTVTTSGLPAPAIVVDQPLPDWLAFDDFGDGTGVLRTVGSVPAGSSTVVVLRALNAVDADATQAISVRVD